MRFQELSKEFSSYFGKKHFPDKPETLYGAASYMLEDGGKRIRPLLCLLGNEIFGPILPDTWEIATALELFHNFTLIHDDIMDKAPLRRGRATVHARYNEPTALLAGDVMLLQCYEYLNGTDPRFVHTLIKLLNKTGAEVCEGQQMDMDFEKRGTVSLDEYLRMIELKTAVLLAASLQMGAIVGGAGEEDQQHLYAFGKNLGLAFQVQDDWLDSFGNPSTFGKLPGGDIMANKKTFLLVHSLEKASPDQRELIHSLMQETAPLQDTSSILSSSSVPGSSALKSSTTVPDSSPLQNSSQVSGSSPLQNSFSVQSSSSLQSSTSSRKLPEKVELMLEVFRATGVDRAAQDAKKNYMEKAYFHLKSIREPDENKKGLRELAEYLLERET